MAISACYKRLVPAGQSKDIEVVFNSNGLPSPSVKNGNLIFTTNAPGSPHDVPAVLVVGPGTGPIWSVTPSELIENHPTNNMVTSKILPLKIWVMKSLLGSLLYSVLLQPVLI